MEDFPLLASIDSHVRRNVKQSNLNLNNSQRMGENDITKIAEGYKTGLTRRTV